MAARTEKEKMLAGERYNCRDPELEQLRQRMKRKLKTYNDSQPDSYRRSMLEDMLGSLGDNVVIWTPFNCIYGENIHLGNHVFLNLNCMIIDGNRVEIGDHAMLGPGVQIYTSAHELVAESRNQGWEVTKPVTIGHSVWIGGSAILLPGVKIGDRSVVGAGAVVTRDVPENVVVAGNPARIIQEIDQSGS
jgi:maltose O-acetyltransferase